MYYIIGSKEIVDISIEEKDQLPGAEVLFETDNFENAVGYLLMMVDNRDSDIFGYKHLKVLDEKGIEKYYQYQYAWLPKSQWIRLNPPPEDLKDLVKPRGEHLRPNLLKLINSYQEAKTKTAV